MLKLYFTIAWSMKDNDTPLQKALGFDSELATMCFSLATTAFEVAGGDPSPLFDVV
jgi:hypothetical protein